MAELKHSILAHGLRMPVEVLPPDPSEGAPRYGLISGWRRVAALRALAKEPEIRADLSHFERGRIAVISAKQGAFETLGDLLQFPTRLSERAGLRLASALKGGQTPALRAALANGIKIEEINGKAISIFGLRAAMRVTSLSIL